MICVLCFPALALQKNVASQKISVQALDASNDPVTGDSANITAYVWQDYASGGATNDTNPTELDSTNAPGIYVFDLTQAETNADNVFLVAVSSTSGVTLQPVSYDTTPAGFPDLTISSNYVSANVEQWDAVAVNAFNAVDTTVSTSDTTTSFTVAAGTGSNDVYNWHTITVRDGDGVNSIESRTILDWSGSRVVTVDRAFSFTPDVGDIVEIRKDYSGAMNVQTVLGDTPFDSTTDTVLLTDGTGAGEISLTAGAVDNVTLVATTTTNTDMRGTDGANTTVPLAAAVDQGEHDATQTLLSLNQLATTASIDRNADLIESQRGAHTWQGNYYYVDPVNGDTYANGNRGGRLDPLLTIQDCHDNLVTDSNHDVIFLVAGNPSGVTTHTVAATTTLSKRYTFLRGPGRDFIITRTGNGDTINITGDGIEISGVQIGTAATGSGDGIQISDADFARIHNCWFLDTQGDGIQGTRISNAQIHDNHFEGTGVGASGEGIHIDGTGVGSSNENVIRNNHFANTGGDAILAENGTIIDLAIENNTIHDAAGWGINISADSQDAVVSYNIMGNNTSGDIQNNGSDTVLFNNERIEYQVWDEPLTASLHNTATTAGRRLREITTPVSHSGTSPGSNAATYINLEATASAVDGTYDPSLIFIESGTGADQARMIMEYDGTLQRAYIKRDWKVIPDATSRYVIWANAGDTHINEGKAQGATATSITLNTLASAVDDTYNEQTVFIVSGTGQDQKRAVTDYDGTTKVATVKAWQTNPDATSIYIMLPVGDDKTGYALSPTGLDSIVMSDIAAGKPAEPGSMNLNDLMSYVYSWLFNETQTTASEHRILDRDETTVKYEHNVSDDGTTFTREEAGAED
jgi:hypothetical protein